MSRSVLRNLGGDITVTSELGEGTTFTYRLPARSDAVDRSSPVSMTEHKPVTIVMIEDDEGHARLIEKNIRRAGVNNEIMPFEQRHRGARLSCSAPTARARPAPAAIC